MSVTSYRFIDPHVLASLANLQLVAKTVVDGFMLGLHQSPKSGVGLEFSQYRSYQPGDDLRRVDWKMYARSDKFFVRESEVETSVTVRFVLDASASMNHTENRLSKFDYARFLIASLAYLAYRQGDAIALHALSDEIALNLEPSRHHRHLHRVLSALQTLQARGKWQSWSALEPIFTTARHRDMLVFVSDMHEHGEELRTALAKLASLRHEVLLCHLVGEMELALPQRGTVVFEDLESGERIAMDADAARAAYQRAMAEHMKGFQNMLLMQHIAYHRFPIQAPLDSALREFLRIRKKVG